MIVASGSRPQSVSQTSFQASRSGTGGLVLGSTHGGSRRAPGSSQGSFQHPPGSSQGSFQGSLGSTQEAFLGVVAVGTNVASSSDGFQQQYGKDMASEKSRSTIKLTLQKKVKTTRKELHLRKKLLLKVVPKDQAAKLVQAGMMDNVKREPEKATPSSVPNSEAGLRKQKENLGKLVNFWSRRIENANIPEIDPSTEPSLVRKSTLRSARTSSMESFAKSTLRSARTSSVESIPKVDSSFSRDHRVSSSQASRQATPGEAPVIIPRWSNKWKSSNGGFFQDPASIRNLDGNLLDEGNQSDPNLPRGSSSRRSSRPPQGEHTDNAKGNVQAEATGQEVKALRQIH